MTEDDATITFDHSSGGVGGQHGRSLGPLSEDSRTVCLAVKCRYGDLAKKLK